MLDLQLFHWDKESRILSAEISELEQNGFEGEWRIEIKSHHTGRVVSFGFWKVVYDENNDVICWEYVPGRESNVEKLIIYND